jgi:hypothetical protein
MNSDRLIPTQFILEDADNSVDPFNRVTFNRRKSPFYEGVRWAVRRNDECLSIDGEWEYESTPSYRHDDFYDKFRFLSLDDALHVYNLSLEID